MKMRLRMKVVNPALQFGLLLASVFPGRGAAQGLPLDSQQKAAVENARERAAGLKQSQDRVILVCQADKDGLEQTQINPDKLRDLMITVFENNKIVAGRPGVYAEGALVKNNGERGGFAIPLVGIPEFIGSNMTHFYFTGSYTAIGDQSPDQVQLVSWFSKVGPSHGVLSLDNSRYATGDVVRVKNLHVVCKVNSRDTVYVRF